MHAHVVYESMFGNTRAVAAAAVEGLRAHSDIEVECVDVGAGPPAAPSTDLLVVLAPTHAFGLSRASTRADAVRQGADGAGGSGIREWIAALPAAQGTAVACADTRVAWPRVPGSAARAALRRLRGRGYHPIAPTETFRVQATPGPLRDGELERARSWGADLAGLLARPAVGS